MSTFHYFRKLYFAGALLLVVIFIGTIGYMLIDPRFSFLDALYMTINTIGTVGFREVHPLTQTGQIFTIFLIITGFGTFAFAISSLTSYVLTGEFREYYRITKNLNAIEELSGHTIICGYGRNGRQAAHVLKKHGRRFVVIEQKKEVIDTLKHKHSELVLEGDATQDDILGKAGIARASSLITTLPIDADNLFIVLSARTLNPNLIIISRASDDNSDKKLKIAGANNVIMPDKIGGAHMASLVLKPDVIEFIDHITGQGGPDINLEEILFDNLPIPLRNKTIRDLEIRNKSGANIVGFKKGNGEFVINPDPDTQLIPDGKLFVLGTPEQIQKLKTLLT
ncbi:MAG: potassium channel protein [Bacteroidetes bacterium]|nr:potassium channel protein [Bacteroidota bacterium]PHX82176.1 MAG: potassium channel protein [Flavobacteriales bacterium]